jgi:hypothetical protein
MAADFFSFVAWVLPVTARRLVREMEGTESLGDIVGPRGQTIHDFTKSPDLSIEACARAMKRRGARPVDFEAAFVAHVPSVNLTGRARGRFSFDFPILSVLDRVIAIPHGVSFMHGRAYRRLRPKARGRAEAAFRALVDSLGGERGVAKRIAPYVDRGGDTEVEARRAVRDVLVGFERARAMGRDLVLAGCNATSLLQAMNGGDS